MCVLPLPTVSLWPLPNVFSVTLMVLWWSGGKLYPGCFHGLWDSFPVLLGPNISWTCPYMSWEGWVLRLHVSPSDPPWEPNQDSSLAHSLWRSPSVLSVFQIRKIHVSFPSSTRGLLTFLASKPIASLLGVQPEPFMTGSGSIAWWTVSGATLSPQQASSNDGSQKRMCAFV